MAYSVFAAKKAGWMSALLGGWDKALIVIAAFALLILTRVNPAVVILGSAAFGFFVYR
jgi:hypothetical protein